MRRWLRPTAEKLLVLAVTIFFFIPVDAILNGVHLDEGEHMVELSYRPASVIHGVAVSGLALLWISARWWMAKQEDE